VKTDRRVLVTVPGGLRFLHGVLTWAAEQKFLVAVPKFPTVKVPKTVPLETFERLLAKAEADPQLRAFLLCGWLAGLRLAEAFALEWEPTEEAPHLDLARPRPRIVLPAGFVKAVEDQWVPCDPELRQALERLPRTGRKVFHFTDSRGRPVTVAAVGRRVIRLAKLAGVKMTMKTLRRGFGCRHAGKVSAQVLQKLMRHSDIRITMDYYANVDEAAEEAIFGAEHNSSRNKAGEAGASPDTALDVTNCSEGASGHPPGPEAVPGGQMS
jgi:integrase